MAKKSKPTDHELVKFRLYFRLIDLAAVTVTYAIPWGALVLIGLWITRAIEALAGKTTFADIGLQLLADIKVSEWVAYIFGGAGVAYGLKQNRLLKQTIERLSASKQRLEKVLDPNRTSSTLTPQGTTNPEDA